MDWLAAARLRDPLGLVPSSDPRDNELVAGHLAGDNFWALAGADEAAAMARRLGREAEAAAWARERDDLRAALERALDAAASRTGGRIPPALDAADGQDWGNLWAAYPGPGLDPRDARVTATLRHARRRFREGLATWLDGRVLHHYLGFRVLQTELRRGEQDRVVRGLYAALAHTTATHGGWETGIHPYGSRSVDDNMSPHGWWAAEYVALLRNMLVREQGDGVVLGSALPPGWLGSGKTIRVGGAPTTRGRVSWSLRSGRRGAVLSWSAPAGVSMTFRIPSAVREAAAPGLARGARSLQLPTARGRMRLRWRLVRRGPTYARAVEVLRRGYARRGR
jgi:hypothetical protein